jgi:hypothetical protein
LRRSALSDVAQRSGVAATVALLRIRTDVEINVNEQPQGISLAGKDIRDPDDMDLALLGAAETVVGLTEMFKPFPERRGLYRPSEARAAPAKTVAVGAVPKVAAMAGL